MKQILINENGVEVFQGQICELEEYISQEDDLESLDFVGLDEYFYEIFDDLTNQVMESAYTSSVTKSEVYKLKEKELELFKSASESEKTQENFPLLYLSASREGVSINEIATIIEGKITALTQLVSKLEDYKNELSNMKSIRLYESKKSIYNRLVGEVVIYAKSTFGIDVQPISIDCDFAHSTDDLDDDLNNPNDVDVDEAFEFNNLNSDSVVDVDLDELDEIVIVDDTEM